MSGRSTYQKGQKGGFRGGERSYQGRGNSGGDRGFDNKHLFNRSKQSKSFKDLHSFELGSPMEVSSARPDITCAVNFLTTRVREPTADDLKKLIKVIKYLNGTIEYAIRLGGDSDGKVKIYAFADASYGVHPDGKSHTGIFITLGCGPLMWKSIKQKCVTRSSFEAEIIALSDIVSLSIWIRDMLREIGEIDHDEPVIIMEDNKAAITVLKNGASTYIRQSKTYSHKKLLYTTIY